MKITGKESVIARQIEQPMTGEVKQNGFRFIFVPGSFNNGGPDGMAGFRCRDNSLGLSKKDSGLKTFELVNADGLDNFFPNKGADNR